MRYRLAALWAALLLCAPDAARADATGALTGVVLDGATPAAGAVVVLRGPEGVLRTVRADARGAFAFARVPFGAYGVAAGASPAVPVVVAGDGVVAVRLRLDAPRSIGSVDAVSSRGPANAPVSVTLLDREAIATLPASRSLDRLIETAPGVVAFAYGEPIAHGFHGVTYVLDGVPVPRGSAANLGEILDPRDVDAVQIRTGAFPAEDGGERQGAVVDLVSARPAPGDPPFSGAVTAGLGTTGAAQTSLTARLAAGPRTRVLIDGSLERTDRGLDAPTLAPLHDRANRGDLFVRSVTDLGAGATLAASYLDDVARFEIPIDVDPNDPNDPVSAPATTDDVQVERSRQLSLSYTKTSADGRAYVRVAPWLRTDRTRYLGDVAQDLAGRVVGDDGTAASPDALRQDRVSTFTGLRLEAFRLAGARHALKAGLDGAVEAFSGASRIAYVDDGGATRSFVDDAARRGATLGAYAQDKWSPTPALTLFGGLRYDRSTGYVSGGQLSPRLEANLRVGRGGRSVVHAYYGRAYAAPYLEDTRRAAVVLAGGDASAAPPVYDLRPERDAMVELGFAHAMSPRSRWYVNLWKRDVVDALDTTSLARTPVQAVFNNAVGVARGVELRVEDRSTRGDTAFLSASLSSSVAGGVGGGTFLFCPPPADAACVAAAGDTTLQPEDHDQRLAVTAGYVRRLGRDRTRFVSLAPQFGTGYPVAFQSGEGRLPNHFTLDAAFGRDPGRGPDGRLGYALTLTNLTDRPYPIKVDNGFNATQYAEGFRADLRLTKPF